MGKLPLDGIRVVEIGNAWTGPFITQTLGDLGAEVIKVETIQRWSYNWRADPNVKEETIKATIPFAGRIREQETGEKALEPACHSQCSHAEQTQHDG